MADCGGVVKPCIVIAVRCRYVYSYTVSFLAVAILPFNPTGAITAEVIVSSQKWNINAYAILHFGLCIPVESTHVLVFLFAEITKDSVQL